jgi:hypothetical protein
MLSSSTINQKILLKNTAAICTFTYGGRPGLISSVSIHNIISFDHI